MANEENLLPGAPVGNASALRDGLYAVVAHQPDVEAVADKLREAAPIKADGFEVAIWAASLLICQIGGVEEIPKLGTRKSADYRGKLAELRRYLSELGLTPTSAAKLGLDVVRGQQVAASHALSHPDPAERERLGQEAGLLDEGKDDGDDG